MMGRLGKPPGWVVSNCIVISPAQHTIAAALGAHLSTFPKSDTLDSHAINAIFHAYMTVVSGGNVCGLATICLVELFVCLATYLPVSRQSGSIARSMVVMRYLEHYTTLPKRPSSRHGSCIDNDELMSTLFRHR